MAEQEWQSVPIGIEASRYVTRAECKSVLVAVHTVVAGQRLMDVVGLVESDPRVQLVFSRVPGVFSGGVDEYLKSLGALEIPWSQAIHERFDLALAAARSGIDQIDAPLVLVPHGAAYGKRVGGCGEVYGLDSVRLMRDGRVIPAALVLSHDSQRDVLAKQCPPAVDVAVVAGDPCFDRMVVSAHLREDYRWALGVRPGRELVLITSTWGTHSLFSRFETYLPTLLRQLEPERYRVAMMVHPAAWFGHGRRQVRAWLSEARAAGLLVIEPDVDWRAVMIAADYVIGDHGSTTTYAAALGRPVLCTDIPIETLNPDSPQALLGAAAPRLIRARPIEPQLHEAATWWRSFGHDSIARHLTSRPGHAHRLLRGEMYRLLGLRMPGRHRAADPVPVPEINER